MKTVAKVFIIIGMVVGCYTVLPLIFGFIALNKLKNNTMTTGFKVCVLLFVNVVAGILLLCMPKEEPAVEAPATEAPAAE